MRKTEQQEAKKDRKNKGSRKQTFPLYVDYFVPLTQNITVRVFLAAQSSCTSQYQCD